jgi:retron-type reverse transcriptase
MADKVGHNQTRTAWILQCDIRKFFASINHQILIDTLNVCIEDEKIMGLLKNVIYSFQSGDGRGLPLGNLTSQLFVNIYMNIFDQFIKHKLKIKYYLRYADDFIIMSRNRENLVNVLNEIDNFLKTNLKLQLHPDKVYLRTLNSGIDFLGWVNFSDYRVLRTKTKKRMMAKVKHDPKVSSLASYVGLIKHGNSFKIKEELLNNYWLADNH